MRRALLPLLLALVALAACAGTAAPPVVPRVTPGCTLTRQADLSLREVRNFLLVPARLDGHFVQLLVDTGAETSTLTPQAARQLRLPFASNRGAVMLGIAGPFRSETVRVHEFVVGDVVLANKRLGLIPMPPFRGEHPAVVGLLGTDLLAGFEVDLDVPAGRMLLYAAQGCHAIEPWRGGVAVPIAETRSGLMFVDAVVNGVTVRALLDSGARTTLIARGTAARLGVTPAMLARDPARVGMGVGRRDIAVRQHRFASIGLPGAMDHDVIANVADLRLPGIAMLLGADYLARRHIWISYATNRLFVRQDER